MSDYEARRQVVVDFLAFAQVHMHLVLCLHTPGSDKHPGMRTREQIAAAVEQFLQQDAAVEVPDTVPPDDRLHAVKVFGAALQNLIAEFCGPEWELSVVELAGVLEMCKVHIITPIQPGG